MSGVPFLAHDTDVRPFASLGAIALLGSVNSRTSEADSRVVLVPGPAWRASARMAPAARALSALPFPLAGMDLTLEMLVKRPGALRRLRHSASTLGRAFVPEP